MRVIARSFLAFGKKPEEVRAMLAEKNPDMVFWIYTYSPLEKPPAKFSLNVTKDGWHFQLAEIKQ